MTDQPPEEDDLIRYRTADDAVRVDVFYECATFWLDQRRVAELFGVDVRTVGYHLNGVYGSDEFPSEATLLRFLRVRRVGTRDIPQEAEFCFSGTIGGQLCFT